MTAPPADVLKRHLEQLLDGRDSLSWELIVPVGGIAQTEPDALMGAFGALSETDQYGLLTLLRTGSAGPFGDIVLTSLSRNCAALPDGDVLDYLLEDAHEAAQRMTARLEAQREWLAAEVSELSRRQASDFDTAAEIARLDQRRNELRLAESNDAERYSQMHAIESEVYRLETNRRILDNYDREAREQYRAELAEEEESLQSEKLALEARIAAAIAERDGARRATVDVQRHLDHVEGEARMAAAELTHQESQLAAAQQSLDTARRQARELSVQMKVARAEEQSIRDDVVRAIAVLRQTESLLGSSERLAQSARDRLGATLVEATASLSRWPESQSALDASGPIAIASGHADGNASNVPGDVR